MELSDYEYRVGKSRHYEVKIVCEYCGKEAWVKWTRRKEGKGRFCSIQCSGKSQVGRTNDSKEKAAIYWNETRKEYIATWFEGSKQKNTTYSRWYLETHGVTIPDNCKASYRDGDKTNISPDNIFVISSEEIGERISKRLTGVKFTEEHKKNLSIGSTGKVLSEEHVEKIRENTKKLWKDGVFDAPEIRKAYSDQGKSTKGSKRTDEQRKKMSENRTGKPFSANAFTPEAIEKRRKKLLGRKTPDDVKAKISKSLSGRKFTEEHLEKLSIAVKNRKDLKGENSKWWKGGVSNSPYPDSFDSSIKRKVKKKYNYLCQSCGENVYGLKRGHVHHIDGDKQNCVIDNLVLLCATCHNAVHGRNTITSDVIDMYKSMLK